MEQVEQVVGSVAIDSFKNTLDNYLDGVNVKQLQHLYKTDIWASSIVCMIEYIFVTGKRVTQAVIPFPRQRCHTKHHKTPIALTKRFIETLA